MMYPCKACRVREWSFEVLEDGVTIRATCGKCKGAVEWKSAKLLRKKNRVYAPFKPHFSDDEIRNQDGPPPWDTESVGV